MKYQNIDARIEELKEIALQIISIFDVKEKTTGIGYKLGYAYTYLEALTNDKVRSTALAYDVSISEAYKRQLIYVIGNLNTWRGNEARAYKLLLKQYLDYFEGKQNTAKLNENVSPLWGMITGVGD